MKTFALTLIFISFLITCSAQLAPQKYFIEFMDKNNSQYSIHSPSQFLSLRAIARRQRQGIAVEMNDIPVSQTYINRIREFNAIILNRSKWFNGVEIYCLNLAMVDSISRLPFVKKVYKSNIKNIINNTKSNYNIKLNEVILHKNDTFIPASNFDYNTNSVFNYGPSLNQIRMVKGDSLQGLGYRGQGIVIAIMAEGFLNVDKIAAFDSLFLNNQILGVRDFVAPGNNVYKKGRQGMEFLSCLAGILPGKIIGTAPMANYLLLRTDDEETEYLIEEYNWVCAAEYADSAGADIITTSVGYTQFDDPFQNHSCSDMSGDETPVTKGANIAASKGMIVVCGAGDNGKTSWGCLGAPADGLRVLAVAATDSVRMRAGFSSFGTSSNRIKPNVAAMGQNVVVADFNGDIGYNSSTSFSAAIVSGLAACLWQALPTYSNSSIIRSIELSSNQLQEPDSLLGYGIPDFIKAFHNVGTYEKNVPNDLFNVIPNPFTTVTNIEVRKGIGDLNLALADMYGNIVISRNFQCFNSGGCSFTLKEFENLKKGSYLLKISCASRIYTKKIIKTDK